MRLIKSTLVEISAARATGGGLCASYEVVTGGFLMAVETMYTGAQVATAARELREAAGADEEMFTGEQVIAMLSEEILLLRERGFTDERIAGLFNGFDIDVTEEQIARHAQPTV